MTNPNPFGVPDPDEWADLIIPVLRRHGGPVRATLTAEAVGDCDAVTAAWPKRWDVGLPPPWPLRPGDLLMMRGGTVGGTDSLNTSRLPGAGTVPQLVLDAVPFWLPGDAAWGLAHTDVPDDPDSDDAAPWLGLRLPAPEVSAWWSPRITLDGIDPRPRWVSPMLSEWMGPDGRSTVPVDTPAELAAVVTIGDHPANGTVDDVAPVGIVLLSDPETGRPSDVVVWIAACRMLGGPRDGGWLFAAIPGLRSRCDQWRFVEAVTAVVAWGDWVPDAPLLARNRGKLRRLQMAGIDLSKLGPVRVLDARRRETLGDERTDPTSTHASPVTHIRRGHFRRQRVGPRGEGRSEVRWIQPTIVNPDGSPDARPSVLTLPEPERGLRSRLLARRAQGRDLCPDA